MVRWSVSVRARRVIHQECLDLLICLRCTHKLTFYPSGFLPHRESPGYHCAGGGCNFWFEESGKSVARRVQAAISDAKVRKLTEEINRVLSEEVK